MDGNGVADFGNLKGKLALITGASEGIGRACAVALNQGGAKVALLSRTRDKLVKAQQQLPYPAESLIITADVASQEEFAQAIKDAISQLGGLDILVNNAGGTPPIDPSASTFMAEMMKLNVVSVHTAIEAACPALLQSKGSVVNIGSALGAQGAPDMLQYGAAKAAVHSLTQSYALKLAKQGVRVNTVAPAAIETEGF